MVQAIRAGLDSKGIETTCAERNQLNLHMDDTVVFCCVLCIETYLLIALLVPFICSGNLRQEIVENIHQDGETELS